MARFPKREDRVNDTLSGKGSGKGLGRIVNPDLKRLAILAVVLLATPATADPAEDTVQTIGKEWCENHGFKGDASIRQCLTEFTTIMASEHGFQEAALTVCPNLKVVDQKLREQRTRKYGGTDEFRQGFAYVTQRVARGDYLWPETVCLTAPAENGNVPYAYREKSWLELDRRKENWKPLVTERPPVFRGELELTRKSQQSLSFQVGYWAGFGGSVPPHPIADLPEFRRGFDAGSADRYRVEDEERRANNHKQGSTAARHGIPTISGGREWVAAGGLISYGNSIRAYETPNRQSQGVRCQLANTFWCDGRRLDFAGRRSSSTGCNCAVL